MKNQKKAFCNQNKPLSTDLKPVPFNVMSDEYFKEMFTPKFSNITKEEYGKPILSRIKFNSTAHTSEQVLPLEDLNTTIISVGKPLPNAPLQLQNMDTTTFELMGDDMFHYSIYLPRPTQHEIEIFEKNPIDVRCYSSKGKNALYFHLGKLLSEIIFNPNLYEDNRIVTALNKKNFRFYMTLIDSTAMTVKAIRVVKLDENVTAELKQVWIDFMNTGTTHREYLDWVQSFIYKHKKENLYKKARKLGTIYGGLLTENLVTFNG